ncbi:MAG: glycosyltransferase family 39 protein [Candidatus Omnitrophota bacterium]
MKRPVPARGLFFILLVVSLAYTLPAYNKYWAPYDEGIITVASQCLLAGELPYKDFFIIMYPPGQIYFLAFLFKIFSFSLTAGRIYTVLLSVGISLLVFYMTLMLTKRRLISLLSWFFVLVSLAPRLGAIPSPIWPGVFLGLLTIYVYMRYLENPKYSYIILAGIIAGLAVLFRHDIGIFAIASVLGSLFIMAIRDKKAIGRAAVFSASAFVVITPCIAYFVSKSASRDLMKSLIFFPFIHQKTASLPFPAPCFNPNMIFHGSLSFIKINQYYIPILVYFFAFIYLVSRLFKKELYKGENLALVSILLFGIFTFNQVITRTDPAHLLTVIQPAAILFGFLAHKALLQEPSPWIKKAPLYAAVAILLFLFMLLSVKNMDKYVKNNFRKVYKKDVIKTQFDRGSIYVPKDEREEVLKTLRFIKKNTSSGERIYIGNIVHWKDDYNGSILLYFLADRLPATKYYEQAPGLLARAGVQEEIRDSLAKHKTKLLVLQDIVLPRSRGDSLLDVFIRKNYKFVKKFGKYNIYLKK